MNPLFWRKWHRWIAWPATLFLLWVSVTGIVLASTEFFGADEALREANRKLVSPVTLGSAVAPWGESLARAFASVAAQAGNAPVDQVIIQFKGKPTVAIYTGKPTGREDRKFTVDAGNGELLASGPYVDKPFLNRLHSGEAFGDGGLVFAMFWGLALAVLTASGLIIYLTMWRPRMSGIRRVFW